MNFCVSRGWHLIHTVVFYGEQAVSEFVPTFSYYIQPNTTRMLAAQGILVLAM